MDQVAQSVALENQQVNFCSASDGTTLAYSITPARDPSVNANIPIVRTGMWFTHLEFELTHSHYAGRVKKFSSTRPFLRYDMRGTGLSDRNPDNLDHETTLLDMLAVIDHAGFEKVILLGISQGGCNSLEFAARYPERVDRLIVVGGYAKGALFWPEPHGGQQVVDTFARIIEQGWEGEDDSFRNVFSNQFFPGADPGLIEWLGNLQKAACSANTARDIYLMNAELDVTEYLDDVQAPTLIVHAKQDRRVPIEIARGVAARLPYSQLVEFESLAHLPDVDHNVKDAFYTSIFEFLGDPAPKGERVELKLKMDNAIDRVEKSSTYKLLMILALLITLVSFVFLFF